MHYLSRPGLHYSQTTKGLCESLSLGIVILIIINHPHFYNPVYLQIPFMYIIPVISTVFYFEINLDLQKVTKVAQ